MEPLKLLPAFDLALDLPPPDSRNLLASLHRQLRAAILDGRLRSGLRLPATRTLAEYAGVSRNTAVAAYDLLIAEGYAISHRGAGTFVAESPHSQVKSNGDKVAATRLHHDLLQAKLQPPWRDASLQTASIRPRKFDFRPGYPDQRLFPFDIWRRLTTRASRHAANKTVSFGDPQGDARLRAGIAAHVSAMRAVACTADNIIITAGAQQAFDLLARIFVAAGRTRVAIENPGYLPIGTAMRGAGAKLYHVAVDDEGFMVERCPKRIDVIAVAPSHQFPLGVTLSAARRSALLAHAARANAIIIEDDYDGEFRLSGRPLDALQTIDHDERVIYVGTFSKSLFPALRMGYIVAPSWVRAALVAAKQASNWHVAASTQSALADFIHEGHLARHVRRMRSLYKIRNEQLREALTKAFGDTLRLQPSLAGLHFAATMAQRHSADTWARRAADAGIRIETLAHHTAPPVKLNGLIFGYGLLPTNDIERAVAALARAVRA
jgi:GntR family transcriptional regulator / MocR family aminotransferase